MKANRLPVVALLLSAASCQLTAPISPHDVLDGDSEGVTDLRGLSSGGLRSRNLHAQGECEPAARGVRGLGAEALGKGR
jgi:hypothetical protein